MRLPDWQERLDAEITAAKSRPFSYGSHDCWLFVADCVLAMTGIDYAAQLRGYSSKEQAYEVIARYGSQEAMITSLLGEPIHPAFAQKGDVMLANVELAPGEAGESGAICDDVKIWTPRHPTGLRSFPRRAARLAWRIS